SARMEYLVPFRYVGPVLPDRPGDGRSHRTGPTYGLFSATVCQYTDLPPEMSNTDPVAKEFSSEESHVTIEASSLISRKRPRGIFESMNLWNSGVIWSKMRVLAAAGVTTLTAMLWPASSLPSDFEIAMTAAFDAL